MRGWSVPWATVVVSLIALGMALAGCLGPGGFEGPDEGQELSRYQIDQMLTSPVHDKIHHEEAVVDTTTGARIWLDLYRPQTEGDETVPVILVKTPYQIARPYWAALSCLPTHDAATGPPKDCHQPITECTSLAKGPCPYIPWLADYYAPRGYAVAFSDVSGFNNSGGCNHHSGPEQWQDGHDVVEWLGAQDWSNGNVGMYGASYDAETQIGTALLAPPSLKTIVPSASVSNLYEFSFYDGVPYRFAAWGTIAFYTALSLVPSTDTGTLPDYSDRLQCHDEPLTAAADTSGDWSPYWNDRDFRPRAADIRSSVLQTHGLQDWNVKPNHLDGFWNELTSEKRLIIGQWEHDQPERGDWGHILHRWFDHHLHGIDTGILDDLPPVLTQDTTGAWRGIDTFPPQEHETLTLWPTPTKNLTMMDPEEGTLTITDHPRQAGAEQLPPLGMLNRALSDEKDRLVFETDPLDEPLHYTGRPLLHLHAKTDDERTRWAAHLIQVSPKGEETLINRGYMNTRHIDGLDEPRDLEPDETYTLTLRMFPQDDVIGANHTLRLVITNADDWVQQDTTYATSQILLGEKTRLELPLAPAGEKVPPDTLRTNL